MGFQCRVGIICMRCVLIVSSCVCLCVTICSWFFTFARCVGGFSDVDFKIHAVQSDQSSWNREFGSNENGLNSLYLAFFLLFTILIAFNCRGTYQLQQKLSYLHPMIKLFLIVLIMEYLSIFLLLIHYGSYANNGVGILLLMKLGEVFAIVSRCFFMLLLLLLAKGWTISHETLTHKWAVIGVVFAYLGMSVFMLVWSYAEEDPLHTTPGKSIVAMTIIVNLVWLVFAVWFSITIFFFSFRKEQNPSKRSMYLNDDGQPLHLRRAYTIARSTHVTTHRHALVAVRLSCVQARRKRSAFDVSVCKHRIPVPMSPSPFS
jgi:hypothetical protein